MYSSSTPKHKTFISFHHKDENYKKYLEEQWGEQFEGFVSKSVRDGDINPNLPTETIRQKIRDEFIADATVTVVLVGQGTWRRKHVDWEIASSLRDTKNNSRTGMLGILLPSYSVRQSLLGPQLMRTENGDLYNPYTIPPRLYDNIECGFAKIYSWPSYSYHLRTWIHDAFIQRNKTLPVNSRELFSNNRSDSKSAWTD
jgi:antiphage defense system Thoeris ThsB-like protein